MITLYRKNALGIGIWSIWHTDNVITISYASTLDGQQIQQTETVQVGKQSRTLIEQVQHRIASRVSKQKDKGYTEDLEAASKGLMNQLGLDVPMLAQPYKDQDVAGAYIQLKLNGLRCLATKQNGEVILYSRRGKRFEALHEIAEQMSELLAEGETFDGELYCHGTHLQTIQSWAKARQPETANITYNIYDVLFDDCFSSRLQMVRERFNQAVEQEIKIYNVKILPTRIIGSKSELLDAMANARKKGFEGLMVRLRGFGYENGKRSKSLLKVKQFESDEAICKDIELSEKGNPVGIFVWQDKTFRASPPGSHASREMAYFNKSKYVGRRCTFEYAELTADGIPFHATMQVWRED